MFVEFKKLTAENFTPYPEFSIEFLSGKTVITGKNEDEFSSNGAGKSTIFESLFWALFGKLMRDGAHPSPLDKKPTRVTLDFNVDGTGYHIIRERESRANTVKLLSEEGNDLSLGTPTMTQDLIQRLIKFTPDTFLATTLFDGSTHSSFATMTDSAQKKLFSDLLQLDIWSKCESIAKDDAAKIDSTIADTENEIVRATESVKTLRELYKEAESRLTALSEPSKEDFKGLEDIEQLEKEIENQNKELKLRKARREIILAAEAAAKQAKNEIALVESEIRNCELKKQQLQADIKRDNDKMKHLESGVCPECKQKIKNYEEEIEKLSQKVHKGLMTIQKVQREHEELLYKVQAMRPGVDSHDWTACGKLSREIAEIEFKLSELGADMAKRHEAKEAYNKALDAFRATRKALKAEMENLSSKGKKAWEAVNVLNTKWAEVKTYRCMFDYILKMFGRAGIQTSLIRGIEGPINQVLKEFTTCFGFRETKVEMSTFTQLQSGEIRDRISVALVGNNGKTKRDFKSFSQGERRRLDLVFFLALREMLSARLSTNLIVFDEVINNLDPTGVESLRLLIDAKFGGICTWIAIPTDFFEWSFQNQITAVKKGGRACLKR